ncbi:MAG: asparagine synthase C-terminal domain-containing protein [Verrucomicrobiota bacterium]
MLSGGLDSSSIVAVAQEILREQGKGSLPTFSAVSVEDPEGPETTAIREVIRHTGVKGREIVPDEMAELGVETDEAIRHSDDPFDLLITLVPAAFSAASMEGCRTIMTGVDGDVCSGVSRRYLIYQFRSGNLISPWIEAAGLAFTSGDGWRYAADLLRFSILSAFRPEKTRENHREGWTRRILDSSPLSTEFAERIGLEERVAALYERELPWPEPPSLTHRHVHSLQSPIMTAALERYDRNAHRFSIELAHPFLDRRFVEFSLRLPIRQRARFGWSKWVLRKTTEGLLPRSARWRRENMTVNPEFARRGLVNGLGSGAFSSGALGGIQSLVSDEVFARATGAEAPSPTDYEGLFVSRTCRFLGRWRETRFPNRES